MPTTSTWYICLFMLLFLILSVNTFLFFQTQLIAYSLGAHGDIFTPFGAKVLTQNLKSLPRPRRNQSFLC